MSWPRKIETLRKYVEWECRDIPPDLVLGIIKHESAGVPGIKGTGKIRTPGILHDVDGNAHEVDVALGLMQCIPAVVNGYNSGKTGADVVTYEDMTGDDDRAIRMQIRTGCYYLGAANNVLHGDFPETCPERSLAEASDDQISLVLTAYAVGAGATSKKMEAAKNQGYSPTYKNLKIAFPNWGKNAAGEWVNRPLLFAKTVMQQFKANRSGSYTGTRAGDIVERVKNVASDNKGAFLALAVLLTGAGWAIQRYYSRRHRD